MLRNSRNLQTMTRSRYEAIVERLKGKFKVPRNQRTADQVKALNLMRKRNCFIFNNGRLLCHGNRVIVKEELALYVERAFKENHECGSRILYNKLKE